MTKSTSDETPANAGIVYLPIGNAVPRDILTWYDFLNYRIWLHSRNSDEGYKQVAIEIQLLSEIGQKMASVEIGVRLELAKLRTGEVEGSSVTPGSFRQIPVGRIIEQHAKLISEHLRKQTKKDKQQIRLVKNYEMATYSLELKPIKKNAVLRNSSPVKKTGSPESSGSRAENLELRANARDSIFITFVYAEQVKAGSRQPALVTAQLLGIKVSLVYIAVRTARKKNWLTSNGHKGAPVGALTPEGIAEYKKINGESLYSKYVTSAFKGVK